VNGVFWGQGADQGTVGVGTVDEEVVSAAFDTVGKGDSRRRARRPGEGNDPPLGCELTLSENDQGNAVGLCEPAYDIVRLPPLYEAAQRRLNELI